MLFIMSNLHAGKGNCAWHSSIWCYSCMCFPCDPKCHFRFSSLHLTMMYTWKFNRIQIGCFKGGACMLLIKKYIMLVDKYYIFNCYLQHSMMALLCACFNHVISLIFSHTKPKMELSCQHVDIREGKKQHLDYLWTVITKAMFSAPWMI